MFEQYLINCYFYKIDEVNRKIKKSQGSFYVKNVNNLL